MSCSFFLCFAACRTRSNAWGHASPALCPVRALLVRVSLGPQPWLHQLRRRLPGFVRRLHRYYAGVRLLWIVHQRLQLLAFPLRTIFGHTVRVWPIQISPVPEQRASVHARVSDHAGSGRCSQNAPTRVAFRGVNNVGTRVHNAFAARWLAIRSPTDASQSSSRTTAHGLGDVGCYSFIAVDFHHILLAGLPAHSLALRPIGLLNRPRRPLSRGFGPSGYPTKPLVSYQGLPTLPGWIPPPLVNHAVGRTEKSRLGGSDFLIYFLS